MTALDSPLLHWSACSAAQCRGAASTSAWMGVGLRQRRERVPTCAARYLHSGATWARLHCQLWTHRIISGLIIISVPQFVVSVDRCEWNAEVVAEGDWG
jgi:hypothetical protein